jgi:predicted membrane protein
VVKEFDMSISFEQTSQEVFLLVNLVLFSKQKYNLQTLSASILLCFFFVAAFINRQWSKRKKTAVEQQAKEHVVKKTSQGAIDTSSESCNFFC